MNLVIQDRIYYGEDSEHNTYSYDSDTCLVTIALNDKAVDALLEQLSEIRSLRVISSIIGGKSSAFTISRITFASCSISLKDISQIKRLYVVSLVLDFI